MTHTAFRTADPSATATSPDVLYLTTDAMTAQRFLIDCGQVDFLQRAGLSIEIATGGSDEALQRLCREASCPVHPVRLTRPIAPKDDSRAFRELVSLIRRRRPKIVNAGTPKAAMVGLAAARLTGVRDRVYLLHGLRLETATGLQRAILKSAEWVAHRSATQTLAVSPSLRDRYCKLGLARPDRISVLGDGTCSGVDIEKFARLAAGGDRVRRRLGIPASARVVGFVGRFVRDKGIRELVESFTGLDTPDAWLLLVGDYEQSDPVDRQTRAVIESHPHIVTTGFVPEPGDYYGAMDLLALPSYREGFPTVPLEAAAAGLPCVGFAATGIVDAIVPGVTGLVVPVGDVRNLTEAVRTLLRDDVRRLRMGRAAHDRAAASFSNERVFTLWLDLYRERLGLRSEPVRRRDQAA